MAVPMFTRNVGDDGSHGTNFEWEATLLSYLRCVELHEEWKRTGNSGVESFRIANNVSDVGALDDIIVRVQYVQEGGVKTKAIFVQCKHVLHDGKDSTDKSKFSNYLGIKEIRKYFHSFVKIYESLEVKSVNKNPLLKNYLDCKFSDCEFVFFSNINYVPRDYLEQNKNGNCSQITSKLFTIVDANEYSILTEKLKEILIADKKEKLKTDQNLEKDEQMSDDDARLQLSEQEIWLISEFCTKFKLHLNQNDKLDVQIESAMKNCKGEDLKSIDNLRSIMVEETKRSFRPIITFENKKQFCAPLTEESDMLSKIIGFIELEKFSGEFFDSYPQKFKLCTKDTIEKISKSSTTDFITEYPRLTKIKIFRALIDLKRDYFCVLVKNEEHKRMFEMARNTCKYKEKKKVFIFFKQCFDFPQTQLENEYFVRIRHDKSESQTRVFQELTDETISEIDGTVMNFQGYDIKLSELCNNWKDVMKENDICDILKSKVRAIGSALPPKPTCYVDRRFEIKVLDEETLKYMIQKIQPESNKKFVLIFESRINIPNCKSWIQFVETIDEARYILRGLSQSDKENDTIHLCMFENNQVEIFYSVGQQSECVQTITVDECYLVDNFASVRNITILTDVAGMGKSTSLLVMLINYKEKYESHWVFFIELRKYINIIEKAKNICDPIITTKFVATKILNLNGRDYELFVNACLKTGNVALFFDGFDEITEKAAEQMLHMLLALEKTKIARVFVSSRPKYVAVVESSILQQSIKFVEFSAVEKEKCLMKCWQQMLNENQQQINISQLDSFVKNIIGLLQSQEKFLNKLLAIPLQIKMIALVYYETLLLFIDNAISNDEVKLELIHLFENYFYSHARHFFADKLEMNFGTLKRSNRDRYIREKLRGSSELAYTVLMHNRIRNDREDLKDAFLSLYELGIITNENPPLFVHRTALEYLAAKYIVEYIFSRQEDRKILDVIEILLVKREHEVLRMFVNSLLNIDRLPQYFNNIGKNETFLKLLIKYDYPQNTPIHIAASEGNTTLLKALLERDNSMINHKNNKGRTALYCGCERDNTEIVQVLLSHQKCLIDVVDSERNTALHAAAKNGNVEIMKLILQHHCVGADSNRKTKNTFQILRKCVSHNHDDRSILSMQDELGETPLYYALKHGKLDAAKFIIEHLSQHKISIISKNTGSALHAAARYNCIEIIELLLEHDKSLLNMQNKYGDTPLHIACYCNNVDAVKILLQHSDCETKVLNDLKESVLYAVARSGCTEIIELILQKDQSLLNTQNNAGDTPLHRACANSNINAVLKLLQQTHCKINLLNKNNDTVLHTAAAKYCDEVIELLLKKDKSLLNMQNKDGNTPLHIACLNDNAYAVLILLQHEECKTNILNAKKDTVLHSAVAKCCKEVVQLLITYNKSQLNMQNKDGNTPLHIACESGNIDAVKMLLQYKKCKINILNKSKETVLQVARRKGCVEIACLLHQCNNFQISELKKS